MLRHISFGVDPSPGTELVNLCRQSTQPAADIHVQMVLMTEPSVQLIAEGEGHYAETSL